MHAILYLCVFFAIRGYTLCEVRVKYVHHHQHCVHLCNLGHSKKGAWHCACVWSWETRWGCRYNTQTLVHAHVGCPSDEITCLVSLSDNQLLQTTSPAWWVMHSLVRRALCQKGGGSWHQITMLLSVQTLRVPWILNNTGQDDKKVHCKTICLDMVQLQLWMFLHTHSTKATPQVYNNPPPSCSSKAMTTNYVSLGRTALMLRPKPHPSSMPQLFTGKNTWPRMPCPSFQQKSKRDCYQKSVMWWCTCMYCIIMKVG